MSWDPDPWPSDPRVRRGLELIGDTIKRRRERLALSQRQLQGLSGVQQSGICRLENGKLTGLRWQRFARIVDALDGLEFAAPEARHSASFGAITQGPMPWLAAAVDANDDDEADDDEDESEETNSDEADE
jgi:transcriptional regulator with XRE-family HTH domain